MAISPITPSDSPKAENRNGSSEPKKPEPSMSSAVLISGGATRHGMAVTEPGSGAACAEFMEEFIAESPVEHRVSRALTLSCEYFASVCRAR